MIAKPPHGEPCNGCGRCCQAEPCILGTKVFAVVDGACPGLEAIDDGKFICGLVAHPAKYMPVRTAALGEEIMRNAVRLLIGEGVGCDASDDEDCSEAFMEKMALHFAKIDELVPFAIALWQP